MKSLITNNQSDSDSDKENTDICFRKNILSETVRPLSQSQFKIYLEELHGKVNYNNIWQCYQYWQTKYYWQL